MWLGFVNTTAMREDKSNKSPDRLKKIVPKLADIIILRRTRNALDSVKHPGQSYDSVIKELVKFWKEKRKEYWTRRKVERESGHRGRDDR